MSEEELKSLFSDDFDIKKIDSADLYESKEREQFGLDYFYTYYYLMTLKKD